MGELVNGICLGLVNRIGEGLMLDNLVAGGLMQISR